MSASQITVTASYKRANFLTRIDVRHIMALMVTDVTANLVRVKTNAQVLVSVSVTISQKYAQLLTMKERVLTTQQRRPNIQITLSLQLSLKTLTITVQQAKETE